MAELSMALRNVILFSLSFCLTWICHAGPAVTGGDDNFKTLVNCVSSETKTSFVIKLPPFYEDPYHGLLIRSSDQRMSFLSCQSVKKIWECSADQGQENGLQLRIETDESNVRRIRVLGGGDAELLESLSLLTCSGRM